MNLDYVDIFYHHRPDPGRLQPNPARIHCPVHHSGRIALAGGVLRGAGGLFPGPGARMGALCLDQGTCGLARRPSGRRPAGKTPVLRGRTAPDE